MKCHENLPYLKHVLDAIADIEGSVKKLSKEEFKRSKDIKDATVRRIEIIGEAVKNISKEFKQKHPEIEWAKIAGTRDIMIHAYFSVDLDIVWNIVKKDLPDLKEKVKAILEEESTKN